MLRSLFSRIEGNGVDLTLTLCLMYMLRRGEHATSNITLPSCTGLDEPEGKKLKTYKPQQTAMMPKQRSWVLM